MPSLTHVCHWTRHGWKRITAEEAAREYPVTVSASSGLFMCELCNQYVTLTNGDEKVRHFKHKKKEANVCPEGSDDSNYCSSFSAHEYELPIRIILISEKIFMLELGLIPVPGSIRARQCNQKIIVSGEGINSQTYLMERLQTDVITYLPIGNVPSASYFIEAGDMLNQFWPRKVTGISCNGTVFEMNSRKRLVENADVQIGRKYYLLCRRAIDCHEDIRIEKVCEQWTGRTCWKVYVIKATAFSEYAARFFLGLKCRLTDSPLLIQPIWPIYVEKPYVIQHNEPNWILHVSGDEGISVKTSPAVRIQARSLPGMEGRIWAMPCNDHQQLFTVGRTTVLQYLYFWRTELQAVSALPQVKVTDLNGEELGSGLFNHLPKEKTLCIIAPFDGIIVIRGQDDFVIEKRNISAAQSSLLSELKMGYQVTVYQGLDAVWSITFEKEKEAVISNKDEEIAKRLANYRGETLPIVHSLGSLAAKLGEYPKVKQWLYKKIRQGEMPAAAYRYFRSFISSR